MKKPKRYYIVGLVEKSHRIQVKAYGLKLGKDFPLSWTDGMVGACPVFANKKKARKYAGKKADIIVIEEVEK